MPGASSTGPGKNYLTVVGEDTCALGKAYAKVMNTQVKSGKIAFLGGFPGNPLSLGWQKCERPALNKNIEVVATEATNWDPSKVQEVVAGILASHPDIKGWSYEYGLGMAQGAFAAYKAAGIPFNSVLTMRTDDVGLGCAVKQLKNPQAQGLLLHRRQLADPGRSDGRDDEAEGSEDPAEDRVPHPAPERGEAHAVREGLPDGGLGDVAGAPVAHQADVPLGGRRERPRS